MYIEEIAKLGIAAGEKTEVCRKSPVKYGAVGIYSFSERVVSVQIKVSQYMQKLT